MEHIYGEVAGIRYGEVTAVAESFHDNTSRDQPNTCINLTEAPRSVQPFRINGFTATKEKLECSIASTRTSVDGHDWEIDYHPAIRVVASFAGRLVDQAGGQLGPSQLPPVSAKLSKGQAKDLFVMTRNKLVSSSYVKDNSFLVELVITVLLDKPKQGAAEAAHVASVVAPPSATAPSSDLHNHFGQLWRSQKGTDISRSSSPASASPRTGAASPARPPLKQRTSPPEAPPAVVRVEIGDEAAALREALTRQQAALGDLQAELDAERGAAAGAASRRPRP
ncbi:hypothetical protein BAE44_0025094 [Dichanthelium oligosanthes]|uniref:MATH domain-containing protein n=1 Tax=Dichanthelium oligosanthes TaxID=888268 RepID=A0A1E5ULZ9_9POAL|nr:hypothetical protein BAE44_0025094 [Dichanthelium oligosanthes]